MSIAQKRCSRYLPLLLLGLGTIWAIAPPNAGAADGEVSVVVPSCGTETRPPGSSNPTFTSSNRRIVVTSGGRIYAIYDPHGKGQQLVWRESGGEWETDTTGDVRDGFFFDRQGGDRPGTIALARDAQGTQHGWVVTSGPDFGPTHLISLQLRRLSDLQDDSGPHVGPVVVVDGAPAGTARADLAFERTRDGSQRGAIAWLRPSAEDSSRYELVVAWFSNLAVDEPVVRHRVILLRTAEPNPTPTLVPTSTGLRLVVTTGAGKLRIYDHLATEPPELWRRRSARANAPKEAAPSAIGLPSGHTLVAVENDGIVSVIRFSKGGATAGLGLRANGYDQPSLSRVGSDALLLMVDESSGDLVSRRLRLGRGWTTRNRIEIMSEPQDEESNFAWPNSARRSSSKLILLVDGAKCETSPTQNTVLYYERPVT
jgi:hypothetical protein